MRRIITNEWVFTISGSARPGAVRVRVTVDNTDCEDRAFAQALAKLIEAWHEIRAGQR